MVFVLEVVGCPPRNVKLACPDIMSFVRNTLYLKYIQKITHHPNSTKSFHNHPPLNSQESKLTRIQTHKKSQQPPHKQQPTYTMSRRQTLGVLSDAQLNSSLPQPSAASKSAKGRPSLGGGRASLAPGRASMAGGKLPGMGGNGMNNIVDGMAGLSVNQNSRTSDVRNSSIGRCVISLFFKLYGISLVILSTTNKSLPFTDALRTLLDLHKSAFQQAPSFSKTPVLFVKNNGKPTLFEHSSTSSFKPVIVKPSPQKLYKRHRQKISKPFSNSCTLNSTQAMCIKRNSRRKFLYCLKAFDTLLPTRLVNHICIRLVQCILGLPFWPC